MIGLLFVAQLAVAQAAVAQTHQHVVYDDAYRTLAYPGGDVPDTIGVCTDVVIRAYRTIGIDLQVQVHEDMQRAFSAYPKLESAPDANIDHRRVANLRVFFTRAGAQLPLRLPVADFLPGDLVTWLLPSGREHIGVVTAQKVGTVPLVVHNIGQGPQLENVLFVWQLTGHYRYPR